MDHFLIFIDFGVEETVGFIYKIQTFLQFHLQIVIFFLKDSVVSVDLVHLLEIVKHKRREKSIDLSFLGFDPVFELGGHFYRVFELFLRVLDDFVSYVTLVQQFSLTANKGILFD